MVTERERQASQLRAEGAEIAQRIRAEADRQQVVIVAEAEREAATLRGEGEATRNAILAETYSKDQEFFEFFRSLEAYRTTFADEGTMMVLSPTSDLLKYFSDIERSEERSVGHECVSTGRSRWSQHPNKKN